jgi:hypothetical protein
MANKFHAQIKNGGLSFGSDYSQATFRQFCKDNEGMFVTIEPRQKITKESRGYFEGALVPAYLEWSGGDPHSKAQAEVVREIFKQEFNGMVVRGLDGQPKTIGLSTAKLSKLEFRDNFIADIVDYFIENNIAVPSTELYKKWRDEYSSDDPLLTFWEWLQRYNLKCDSEVGEMPAIKLPTYEYPTK